jgi:hypothetical protein
MRKLSTTAAVIALCLGGLGASAAPGGTPVPGIAFATAFHITPTVYLLSKPEAIQRELPGATQFFVKQVDIGREDFELVKSRTGWAPEDRTFRFYSGKDASGELQGTVEFVLVDTPHGPIEVALAFGPDGKVSQVLVITATVETVPWVNAVVKSGMLKEYLGLAADARPTALNRTTAGGLGVMPYWAAQVIDKAVVRGLALYDALYRTSPANA